MTKRKPPDISQEAWDAVDSPPLTDEMLRSLRPIAETDPDLVAAYRRYRGQQKAPTKQMVTLRLDPDVVEAFRATGTGWQRRMNDALRKAAGL
ncbi:MAG: BrnA antitoxin family protein [Inquilinus limosus]|uniref:BrnA antitoxin family protein n=1 Tax=Inquilinus limosus TaxID=171674 RepID=A0A952KJ03_9PROT|nr:BrnA antitoxin family protein [Inquilinus limosus]